jgi:signal transduction histidine kinase
VAHALARLGSIADRPGDDAETLLRHRILIYAGLLMSGGGLLWGSISFAFGLFYESSVPLSYAVLTAANYLVLWRTRAFAFSRTFQIAISLLLPFAFQWALGGFFHSGAMMIWSMLCLVGAIAVEGGRRAWAWLIAYIALTLVSGLIENRLHPPEPIRSEFLRTLFYVLNVVVVSSGVFFLMHYFARQRQVAMEKLAASQQALVHSEKLAALGQLVAGVAHELNTPLGAIRASAGNIGGALEDAIGSLPGVVAQLPPDELASFLALLRSAGDAKPLASSKEERKARRALEARLDELGVDDAASVADVLVDVGLTDVDEQHKAALTSASGPKLIELAFSMSSLARNRRNIQTAADRAAKIVFALRTYAHPGADDACTTASVSENIETVLTLYHNQIKRGVEVRREFDDDTTIEAMHDQLNQVWTNLVHNSLQAMGYAGEIEVAARRERDGVEVRVADSGPGIPPDVLPRVFEPFYTTKDAGEGTGLGLSICRDIIQQHGGTIEVDSRPGRTCFTVWLPSCAPKSLTEPPDA